MDGYRVVAHSTPHAALGRGLSGCQVDLAGLAAVAADELVRAGVVPAHFPNPAAFKALSNLRAGRWIEGDTACVHNSMLCIVMRSSA